MGEIGVAIIGAGYMGKCHAMAYTAAAGTFDVPLKPRLEVLCDVDRANAEATARRYGFAHATDDWRRVIEDPRVEVVSITTPNALHAEMAIAALQAGKHVYCEKPMALTLADAEAMAAARAASAKTLVGYNYIKNPAVIHARRIIEEGTIGRPARFSGHYDEDYMADPTIPYSWRCRVADAGTGTLGDLACHLVSVGPGPVAAVLAQTAIVHDARPDPDRPGQMGTVENEDVADALLRFASGATGVISSSRVAWGRKNRLALEIIGTAGTLVFDQERMNELWLYQGEAGGGGRTGAPLEGFRRILTGPQHPPYGAFIPSAGHGLGFNDLKVAEAGHLLTGLAGGSEIGPDFETALGVERVIHGIVEAAKISRWVETGQSP